MSTTVNDIILNGRALLDELTNKGVLIPDSKVADIETKMIRFINMGQKELYKTGQLYKKFSFFNDPIVPVDGLMSGFESIVNSDEIQYYPSEAGTPDGKSYYVEANNTHTVEIQEFEAGSWATLIPHNGVASIPFIAYKGNITVTTPGNAVRMKISGTTYFNHINRAFFPHKFVVVPDYRPWVRLTLPDDFRLLENIYEEFPVRQYKKASQYNWEEPNVFVYNYYGIVNYTINYKPVPAELTLKTDVLEIDDITAQALAYFAASWIAPYENQSMTNPLFQKYTELKFESLAEQPSGEESIGEVGGNYA